MGRGERKPGRLLQLRKISEDFTPFLEGAGWL